MAKRFFLLAQCRGESSPTRSHACAPAAVRALLIATNTLDGCAVARTLNKRLIVGSEGIIP